MKHFFQRLVLAIPVMATTVVANIQEGISKDVKIENLFLAQAQIKTNELELPVALPDLAQVILRGGESISGRVVGIDPQRQAISIQRSGKTTKILLSKVQRIIFKDGALAYRSNGQVIHRGEQNLPTAKPVILRGIPLNTFIVKNYTQGQAVVKLKPPVVSSAQLHGIRSVARNWQYVVDEIQFNSQQQTLTIWAKPY